MASTIAPNGCSAIRHNNARQLHTNRSEAIFEKLAADYLLPEVALACEHNHTARQIAITGR